MTVLLIAETAGGELVLDPTAKAVTAASALGPITALVCGSDAAAAATAAIDGLASVLVANDPAYARGLAENVADLIVAQADGFSHILAPATASGKNILPRVAALLDVMVVSDIVEILDSETFKRPIYAGNAIQTVKSTDAVKVLTVRTASFDPAPLRCDTAPVEAVTGGGDMALSVHIADRTVESDRPELSSAKTVVSGGRGLGSQDDFALVERFAETIGAAVGASRAAVDAGFAPNDWQIGQTGKVVAPHLYVAIGISGAIQHLAGMKDSKVIVAINKDAEAPIFQVADYGLVADLFDALPDLQKALS